MSQKILNKRSSVFGKTPLPSQIEVGEIAINFNHENPFLSILDSNGEIQKFLSETKTRGLVQDAKEDIDNSFYTKEEINNMFEAFDPSGEVDLDNYYTKVESDNKYQPKGNYLTEHQSLENYYTKSEADNKFLTSHQDLSNYALKSEIPDVSNFVTSAFTDTTYAKKGEVPSDAYTKSESDSKFQPQSGMTDYALKSELPSTTGLASEEWVSNNFSSTAHTHSDLATKSELENYLTIVSASTTYATKSEIPDISDLATKSEIPDVSNFVTSAFTEEHYMKIGSTPTDVYTKAESDSKFQAISAMTEYSQTGHTHDYETLTNKPDLSIYLTEHQDISNLATKQELENYMPNSGMTDYVTDSELNTTLEGYSTTAHTHSEYTTSAQVATMIAESGDGNVWTGTKAEYIALPTKDPNILYIITDEVEQWVTSGYVQSELANYQPTSAMTDYVTDSELNTALEGKSNTGHTHSYNDLTDKPTIPTTDNLATKAELVNYQPVSGMNDYVTDSELNTTLEGYSSTAHTHSYNDLEDKPTIPSIAGLASETWVSQNFQPQSAMTEYSLSGHTHSQYLTETSADTRYARVISLTQAEYDALVQNDQVEQGVLYCIIEQSNS